jgi:hypothetical protein
MRDIGNADNILVGKLQGKKPDGIWRKMLEDKIKMDLKEIGCKGVHWTKLAVNRA